MPYALSEHKHRFAAWAAGRAASVKGSRFKVKFIQQLLEDIGFHKLIHPEMLPDPKQIDEKHREWRDKLISAAKLRDVSLSHGVAAKIINVYLKAVFVCGGAENNPRVMALHPPIDSVLLDTLYKKNIGNKKQAWQTARRIRWSLLNSKDYQDIVTAIRSALKAAPMWTIEEHWRGHQ